MRNLISILVIFLIILNSCADKNSEMKIESSTDKFIFFEPADLGAFGSKTRLIIYVKFDECGEWGGHEENFEVFSKRDKQFYVKYKRTKVDCDKVGELYGKPEFQQPDKELEFKLTEKNIIAINNYLSKLLKSKISERFPGHSGRNFGVMKSDSTLIIDVYDRSEENLKNYNTLLNSLKIEEVNYEY